MYRPSVYLHQESITNDRASFSSWLMFILLRVKVAKIMHFAPQYTPLSRALQPVREWASHVAPPKVTSIIYCSCVSPTEVFGACGS